MNTPFDWSLVRAFLAALDQGSLLGASRVLGLSQPTVGRHITQLEAQVGGALFERTGRGLRPTALALRLAPGARAMREGALALAQDLGDTRQDVAGTVRISASQPVACYLLPGVLAGLRRAHPAIEIELVVSNAVSNLLQREADIALRMVRPEQASLVARRIADVGFSACAHRDYLARRGTPREPADLPAHELVGLDRQDDILRGFSAGGLAIDRAQFGLRTDDLVAYWQAVRAGLGIGFVSDYLIATDPAVRRILPGLPLPTIPIWLTVHREIRGSARIRVVYDHLARAVPEALAQARGPDAEPVPHPFDDTPQETPA